MQNVLIELILTNQCNKRCEYCDLDFKNKSLSFDDLDLFSNFLKLNPANYTINFFWWEPLLEYKKLKYFVENSKNYVNNFTIWTNWVFLDKEKLEFFQENNIFIYLSVDNITTGNDLNFEVLKDYTDIININFINDPDYLDNSVKTFNKILNFWFSKISFMPVYSTKKRDKVNLYKLKTLYDYFSSFDNLELNSFWYFNWVTWDIQFILDTNLFFYSDLDSLLWLQKQYKNIDKALYSEINTKTKLISLNDKNLNLEKLLDLHNIKDVLILVFEIPKKTWDILSYKIIDKILKK